MKERYMNVRLLKLKDRISLEEYLAQHKAECMFICSNLETAGIEYKGANFQGEYFGYFDSNNAHAEQLLGVIVHYLNGNVMMHASNHMVLEQLTTYIKIYIKRPVAGILGPNTQAEYVIEKLGISGACFNFNRNSDLFELNLETLSVLDIPNNFDIVRAKDIPKDILIQ
ncbi:MAG: hypothetical protein ACRYE9_03790 [Janthinobacterium lividum]